MTDLNFIGHFSAGMLAEIACCILYVPIDVVKERLQVQRPGIKTQYNGSADALRKIFKYEGVRGVYKVSKRLLVLLSHTYS